MSPSDYHKMVYKHQPIWKFNWKEGYVYCDICGHKWDQSDLEHWTDQQWASLRSRWQDD